MSCNVEFSTLMPGVIVYLTQPHPREIRRLFMAPALADRFWIVKPAHAHAESACERVWKSKNLV